MPNICNKQHRFLDSFSDLKDSQDNQKDGRHKCAGCAFVEGLKDALSVKQMKQDLTGVDIPDSQAGTVRHKDAYEAYKKGYAEAKKYME